MIAGDRSLLARHFIFWLGHTHQPFIKPAHDMLQAFDSMPRLARARKFVRLVWKAHHHRRNLSIFQCSEHRFAARTSRSAIVCLAKNQHQWRLHFGDVSYWRSSFEVFGIFKRCSLEPGWLEESEVGCVPPVSPIRDVPLRNGGGKARRLANGP